MNLVHFLRTWYPRGVQVNSSAGHSSKTAKMLMDGRNFDEKFTYTSAARVNIINRLLDEQAGELSSRERFVYTTTAVIATNVRGKSSNAATARVFHSEGCNKYRLHFGTWSQGCSPCLALSADVELSRYFEFKDHNPLVHIYCAFNSL